MLIGGGAMMFDPDGDRRLRYASLNLAGFSSFASANFESMWLHFFIFSADLPCYLANLHAWQHGV